MEMLTSSWFSWEDRHRLYNGLKPGDILQQKIDGFSLLPGMEHWVLFLGFIDAEQKQPLIVHLVNNDPATSLPSAWSLGSLAIGGSIILGGLYSNAPLVSAGLRVMQGLGRACREPTFGTFRGPIVGLFLAIFLRRFSGSYLTSLQVNPTLPLVSSGGSSLVFSGSSVPLNPGATSISGGVLMSSGGIICGSALAPFISGLEGLTAAEKAAKVLALVYHGGIGLFLLAGGGMMLTSAASTYMFPRSFSNVFSSRENPIKWTTLEVFWQPGQEFRKHNFKDAEWTPAEMNIILERVDSEYRAAKPYRLFTNNCEQFVHYCRYEKRYSGQVAAFSKDVRRRTLGLVRIFDEFD